MRLLLCVSLSALLLGGCSAATTESSESADTPLVAVVDGREITLADLDEWIKDELLREELSGKSASAVHAFREELLGRMIDATLVEQAAEEQGLEPEQLLSQQRANVAVTDEQVAAFYEQNKERLGGAGLEQMSDRIRRHLAGQESQRGEREYLDQLRKQASVEVFMDAPRIEVAAVGPSKGAESAPITIIEFSDFECPFCARAGPVVKQVLARYPEQVRLVYRHFPLESIHKRARAAAEASACAGEQGRFWEYHDLLFANARQLGDEDLTRYAVKAGVDAEAFAACVAEGRYRADVDRDMAEARQAGVTGTPSFFINGRMLGGAQPLEEFVRIIDAELKRAGQS